MDDEMSFRKEISGNSSTPVASEAIIIVRSIETECLNVEQNAKAKANVSERKLKVSEPERDVCVAVDIKCGSGGSNTGSWESEKVCRICHLNSDRKSDDSDLIQLGCRCKGELGIAHRHCGEAWFRIKGNRCCEICSETAKNITGMGDNRFMEEWNERTPGSSGSSQGRGGCWRGQPFCNFLMACIVIAFVLPWFLRVNMF